MAPYSDRQLQRPQGKHASRAAAPVQLLGLLAHVLNQLGSELRGQSGHRSTQRLLICVGRLGRVQTQELGFDGEIDGGVTNLGLGET